MFFGSWAMWFIEMMVHASRRRKWNGGFVLLKGSYEGETVTLSNEHANWIPNNFEENSTFAMCTNTFGWQSIPSLLNQWAPTSLSSSTTRTDVDPQFTYDSSTLAPAATGSSTLQLSGWRFRKSSSWTCRSAGSQSTVVPLHRSPPLFLKKLWEIMFLVFRWTSRWLWISRSEYLINRLPPSLGLWRRLSCLNFHHRLALFTRGGPGLSWICMCSFSFRKSHKQFSKSWCLHSNPL